uniref:Uncharacterized protein n=1 Tax=Lactuca sativa TaxID=4236 RepID=A0A9R1UH26_LACSA|nr:hypothetical protein LSAT_V11C900467500 [Lactuca sativa]
MAESLTTVLTPYAEMVLHKMMKNYVWWQATKIPSLLPSAIYREMAQSGYNLRSCYAIAASRHSNIHELPDVVQIYYRTNVL